jgi:hypothetical protein
MSASFALLYSLEELHNPEITIKVVGHPWDWTDFNRSKTSVKVSLTPLLAHMSVVLGVVIRQCDDRCQKVVAAIRTLDQALIDQGALPIVIKPGPVWDTIGVAQPVAYGAFVAVVVIVPVLFIVRYL